MKMTSIAFAAALAACGATDASAQVAPLSGPYQCSQNCRGPGLAFVTQNGWDLNLVNEVGEPSRAWIDYWGHIWAQYWNERAIYSPDGLTIQFDSGAVWHRFIPPPPPPPVLRSRAENGSDRFRFGPTFHDARTALRGLVIGRGVGSNGTRAS